MNKKDFGTQLQKFRERAGYSQEALAGQIGCSSIFISYLERGVKSPSLGTLVKLAAALDVSMDILLGNTWKNYNTAMLKDIESRLRLLPSTEQQKILELFDSAINIELKHHNWKGNKNL